MGKSFSDRLAALEALEQEAEQPVSIWEPPAPPSFGAVLADFDLLLAALGDGRARVCGSIWTWEHGEPVKSYFLCHMPDPIVCAAGTRVAGLMRDYGAGELKTVEEYMAWISEHRYLVAFYASRTDAELASLIGMDGDRLFWTPEQRALADEWERLLNEEL